MAKKFSCTFTGEDRSHSVLLNGKSVPKGMVYVVDVPTAQSISVGPARQDIERQYGIKFGTWVGSFNLKNHPNWKVVEIK